MLFKCVYALYICANDVHKFYVEASCHCYIWLQPLSMNTQ